MTADNATEKPVELRPMIEWTGSVAELFEALTAPGQVKEEVGPEYRVHAVRLRISVRRSTAYYPRLELHVARKPGPLTKEAVLAWQRDNERLLTEARTIFGIGWTMIEESDPDDSIQRVYLELLPNEVTPGEVPCVCGARSTCDSIPEKCLAVQSGQMRKTTESLRQPRRPIPELFGGHNP